MLTRAAGGGARRQVAGRLDDFAEEGRGLCWADDHLTSNVDAPGADEGAAAGLSQWLAAFAGGPLRAAVRAEFRARGARLLAARDAWASTFDIKWSSTAARDAWAAAAAPPAAAGLGGAAGGRGGVAVLDHLMSNVDARGGVAVLEAAVHVRPAPRGAARGGGT